MNFLKCIHGSNKVYDNFIPANKDFHGDNCHLQFLSKMLELSNPKVIVDVGTTKGLSACVMGNILRETNNNAHIICASSWLGTTDMWLNNKDELKQINGFPTLYYTFIGNVIHELNNSRITPLPQPSVAASRIMTNLKIKSELIHIDNSYEYEQLVTDLYAWNNVLASNGIIFGSGYSHQTSEVIDAVDEFSWDNDFELSTIRFENKECERPTDYWVLSRNIIQMEF